MKYAMELLVVEFKSQYGYRVEFIATELKKSVVDRRQPPHTSPLVETPLRFVFRQETGMQKGENKLKAKEGRTWGYSECVRALKDNQNQGIMRGTHKYLLTFMNSKDRKPNFIC